jgi:hypothetical protein
MHRHHVLQAKGQRPMAVFMRPILLIGTNFVRSQWLTLVVMTVYLAGMAIVFANSPQRQETRFFLQIHSFYLLFIAVVIAVPTLQTERTSRRILAVLSKGIYRWQYLGGILCGCGMILAIFCLLVGGISWLLCVLGGFPTAGLAGLIVALFACCLMSSAMGLFYSTFLHPLLATGATLATLALPFAAGVTNATRLAGTVGKFRVGTAFNAVTVCAGALAVGIAFWLAGAAIFARRDVTVSPE